MNKNHTLEEWVEIGKQMTEDRAKRIKIAKTRKFDTIATHGIYDLSQAVEGNSSSLMEPIYLSTAQVFENSDALEAALTYQMPSWTYTRIANPSSFFLEETVALLESYGTEHEASCVATASGMSAIKSAIEPFLIVDPKYPKPNFVATAKVYGGTYQQFFVRQMADKGIEVRWIRKPDDISEWEANVDDNTRFLYGEFPSNPAVAIFDIEMVANLAHKNNIPLIVDATCASPALTRPLAWGADIVVQSSSKVMATNGGCIGGTITSKNNIPSKVGPDEMKQNFAMWTKLLPFRDNGPAIHPVGAILTLNDMRSLRMRIAQMSRSALKVAEFLEQHTKIEKVSYPGLKSYPMHQTAKKYMKLVDSDENLYGYMMAFDVKEEREGTNPNARKFFDALNLVFRATDLGRSKTVATIPAISTHHQQGEEGRRIAEIKPSCVRLAIGIEDDKDILNDIEQALNKV